jgi:predicted peptidase
MAQPNETFPLIVWLHGYQERGTDGVAHLRWLDQLVFMDAYIPEQYRFFLVALQLPKNEDTWYCGTLKENGDPAALEPDMLAVLKDVVDDLLYGTSGGHRALVRPGRRDGVHGTSQGCCGLDVQL